jgi:mannosyltransferase OCH1-like enzyme
MTSRSIFQTWKSKIIDSPKLKQWQQSWIKNNINFAYVLWDDNDNRKFIVDYFPLFLHIYNSYDREIKRADVIRYFYLYKYGGIYADLDFECLKPFEPILKEMDDNKIDIIFGSLSEMEPQYNLHNIPNALMISKAGCDFWKLVIGALSNICIDTFPELNTGPIFLKTCILYYTNKVNISINLYKKNIFEGVDCDFTSKIFIASPELFYPINWNNKTHTISLGEDVKNIFPTSYAITYWMHSWS